MKTGLQSQGRTCVSVAPTRRKSAPLAGAAPRVLAPVLLLAVAPCAPASAAVQARPSNWAGVYEDQFENSLVSGERYQASNILEIVDVTPTTAYVNLELEFYNGHQCGLYGVADIRGESLVYTGDSIVSDQPCVLTLKRAGGKITLSDQDGICTRGGCGARGDFEGVTFKVSARRPIRYMTQLKASSEYKEALAAYGKR
jgi:hypothetical protein